MCREKINEMFEKYEAKLDFLDKNLELIKHLLDEDTLDVMNSVKILVTEVVSDFKYVYECSDCKIQCYKNYTLTYDDSKKPDIDIYEELQ